MTKFLCIDSGIFVEHCNALAKNGKNEVLYWTPWETSYPAFEDYAPGEGFGYLKKVKYLFEAIDQLDKEKDIIVNFAVGNNDLIYFLRKNGYICLGSGKAEHLEQERWTLKKMLQAAGLQVNHAVKIKGTKNLRLYLQTNKDKYIKVDTFRKDIESFYAKDLESVDLLIGDIEAFLGPFKDNFEFIVEDSIHTDFEFGVDTFFTGGEYLKPYFLALEYQKMSYIAKVVEELPPVLNETMQKMKPIFTKLDYRGPMSTEEKIVNEKEHYFLDFCARLLYPASAFYIEAIRNWPEVVEAMARGKNIRLDVREKYWGAVPLSSSHAKKHWLTLDFPIELKKYIKLCVASKINGKYYGVKGSEIIAVIVAGGNSIQEVIEKLKKYAKEISAYGLENASVNSLDKMEKIMNDAKQVGIFF